MVLLGVDCSRIVWLAAAAEEAVAGALEDFGEWMAGLDVGFVCRGFDLSVEGEVEEVEMNVASLSDARLELGGMMVVKYKAMMLKEGQIDPLRALLRGLNYLRYLPYLEYVGSNHHHHHQDLTGLP